MGKIKKFMLRHPYWELFWWHPLNYALDPELAWSMGKRKAGRSKGRKKFKR